MSEHEHRIVDLQYAHMVKVPCEHVLNCAASLNLERVVVIGVTQSGEPYLACSGGHIEDIVAMLEQAQHDLGPSFGTRN